MAFYLAGKITHVKESIPWVRCASGNVLKRCSLNWVRWYFDWVKYDTKFDTQTEIVKQSTNMDETPRVDGD